jgi:quercetin dioxygenase-like cupin family protein
MTKFQRLLVSSVLTLAVVLFLGNIVMAQDPTKVAPNQYKLLFENDRVRVMEVVLKAGESIVTHSHPDHFVYVISPGKLKLTPQGKEAQELETKEGEVLWLDGPVTHSGANTGTTDFRGIVVELKEDGAMK